MRDFLGQPLSPGDWVAYPGRGNGAAEYGMILCRVESVEPNKIKATRLTCRYLGSDRQIGTRTMTITNLNKLVKVSVPKRIQDLFIIGATQLSSPLDRELISKWIHGARHQNPFGKP